MRRWCWWGVALVVLGLSGLAVLQRVPHSPVVRTVTVGPFPARLAVDDGTQRAFIVNHNGATLSVLDTGTGALVRTVAVGPPRATVTPNDDAVDPRSRHTFVSTSDGRVRMLDARTGALLRTMTIGTQADGLAVDARTERVFVTNQLANTVSVVDARTGRLLRTVAVGVEPTSALVVARTGRVFVTT